eukprot:jgi/Botrbrau1/1332/Bobra.0063s0044.1
MDQQAVSTTAGPPGLIQVMLPLEPVYQRFINLCGYLNCTCTSVATSVATSTVEADFMASNLAKNLVPL